MLAVAVLREAEERVAQRPDGDDGRGVRLVEVAQREPRPARIGGMRHHPDARQREHAVEDAQRVLEAGDLALDRVELGLAVRADLLVHLLHGRGQARVLRELVPGVAVLVRREIGGLAQAHVGHADEAGLAPPAVGVRHHGQDPLDGVEPQDALEPEGLGPGHAPRGLAGVGVEGLDSSTVLDRQRAEGLEGIRPRQERLGQGQNEEGQNESAQLHDGSPSRDERGGPGRLAAGRDRA